MSTIIHPLKSVRSSHSNAAAPVVSKPHYDCTEQAGAVKLSIFLPEVDPVGVEIVVRGTDLIVSGRRRHVVRVNWTALHLEKAMHDYELRLRLGSHLNYAALKADLTDSMLTLTIPKKNISAARSANRQAA